MNLSNLSIFKIGVGPSSSHTVGPMVGANMFCEQIEDTIEVIERVEICLYGSLSLTGKGHLTDEACIIGLHGVRPKDMTTEIKKEIIDSIMNKNVLNLDNRKEIHFEYDRDLIFRKTFLPLHENGFVIKALDKNGHVVKQQTYYSVGGGFIKTKEEMELTSFEDDSTPRLKYEFDSAQELLDLCNEHGKNIAEISMLRELEINSKEYIENYCLEIWDAMYQSYKNGCYPDTEVLPGALNLKRRAPAVLKRIEKMKEREDLDPLAIVDYMSVYALAISEENASGGRVVTAPTNGACAVIPSVILYLSEHRFYMNEKKIIDFLLTAMAIGSLYKKNASISGAEAGCQAEIGSASSMAAAAAAVISGASAEVAYCAAEIAMEHHLGLTCDPVAGLVQIPCIERNVFGAIKAMSACKMAMESGFKPRVSLDQVIETMYKTGKDMNSKYKETSLGGLAEALKPPC